MVAGSIPAGGASRVVNRRSGPINTVEQGEEPDERFFSGDPATVVTHLVEAARAAGWTLRTVEDDGRRLVWVDQGDPSPGRAVLEAVLMPDPDHGCLVRLSETYAGPDAPAAPVSAT